MREYPLAVQLGLLIGVTCIAALLWNLHVTGS
jgi:hypothetical protein